MTPSLVRLEGIDKSYGNRKASPNAVLRNFCLNIRPGEALGISGPSGCGKTTVARIILGVEPPDAGRVQFMGTTVAAPGIRPGRAYYRNVQMVWQDPALYLNPFISIRASVMEPMAAFGIGTRKDRPARADAHMESLGLSSGLGRFRPGQLSGGQCQRAAIARALAVAPKLLICDEALVSLDLPLQAWIIDRLRTVQKESAMALLFISHDRGSMTHICDRVIHLGEQNTNEADHLSRAGHFPGR